MLFKLYEVFLYQVNYTFNKDENVHIYSVRGKREKNTVKKTNVTHKGDLLGVA